jgi:TRAP-type C4-dicarboxylate transport system substrate-binding protein
MRLLELMLALLFALSSGLFFSARFRENKFWLITAGSIAIVSSYFTAEQIYDRFISPRLEITQPLNSKLKSEPSEVSFGGGARTPQQTQASSESRAPVTAPPAVALTSIQPEQNFELKVSHWVPTSHPLHQSLEEWGASISSDSGSTLRYKIYPTQQLGKAFDHYDMARDGTADLAFINPGYQTGRFPVIAAGELPFLISNAEGGSRAIDTWYRKYASAEMKDIKFCLAFVHSPGALHTANKKVLVPADIKGMKIRPADTTIANFVTQLGGTNVQSSAPEVRDLLSKGIADGVTFPWGSFILFGIDKVAKFHLDTPLYTTVFAIVFNRSKYEQMSERQKKVMDNHCSSEWAARIARPWANFENDGIAKLRTAFDHDVYAINALQLAEWKKAAVPIESKWAEGLRKVNVDPISAMQELKAELAKNKASY